MTLDCTCICGGCAWQCTPVPLEPWRIWLWRSGRAWRRHMKTSAPCREATNLWLARVGSENRWTTDGLKPVAPG